MNISIKLTMEEKRVMEKALQRSLDGLRDKCLAISNLLGEAPSEDVEFRDALQRAYTDVSREASIIHIMLERL